MSSGTDDRHFKYVSCLKWEDTLLCPLHHSFSRSGQLKMKTIDRDVIYQVLPVWRVFW